MQSISVIRLYKSINIHIHTNIYSDKYDNVGYVMDTNKKRNLITKLMHTSLAFFQSNISKMNQYTG